jgi:uncharacterized protein YjbI with pentapeptide repeats
LYSTASYKTFNLASNGFDGNDLAGADLHGQNLNHASFYLTNLAGASFSHSNLTNANLKDATLSNVDFTGAQIQGADFAYEYYYGGTGITVAQLYSTASYQSGDLSKVHFDGNDLSGANLSNMNLAGASFQGTYLYGADLHNSNLSNANLGWAPISGANFRNSNLTNVGFGGDVTGADFSGADARGSQYLYNTGTATFTNFIQSNGHINGLSLGPGETLVVRNYHGDPAYGLDPIPIHITQSFTMTAGGTLQVVLDADTWDSHIEFDKDIAVSLGGKLDLEFADNVDLIDQVGRSFQLFDWSGVTPAGDFTVTSPYVWDVSQLYTSGVVTFESATVVPEPSSLLLTMAGLVATAFVFRRKAGAEVAATI